MVEKWYDPTMRNTITMDKAGRIVLPKPLRERFRLEGGARLAVEIVGDHLTLMPLADEDGPDLVEKSGLLVVKSSGGESDALAALTADREERESHLSGQG